MGGPVKQFDVAIVGGGFVGLYLARALADALGSEGATTEPRICVLESQPTPVEPDSDQRRIVLNRASINYLRTIGGVLNGIPLNSLTIKSGTQALNLAAEDASLPDLGEIVAGAQLWHHAYQAAQHPSVNVYYGCQLNQLKYKSDHVELVGQFSDAGIADANDIKARIVIGADGANSWVRKQAGIDLAKGIGSGSATAFRMLVARYQPTSKLNDDQAAPGTAVMEILPNAIAAEIPLDAGYYLRVVTLSEAEYATEQLHDASVFEHYLAARGMPAPTGCTLVGVHGFAAQPKRSQNLVAPRVLLAGMAANAMLAVAAQAMNSGIADIAALVDVVPELLRIPGWSAEVAEGYEKARIAKQRVAMTWTMALVEHGPDQAWQNCMQDLGHHYAEYIDKQPLLQKVFQVGRRAVQYVPKRMAQGAVLGLIDRVPSLKRKIIEYGVNHGL